jgi:Xaa-Pro aminopeptidase
MAALPDGILLVHARSGPKDEEAASFRQDATFYYFTGLAQAPGAILALDATRGESTLFVAPAPLSFGMGVEGLSPSPDAESAAHFGLTRILPWDGFVEWVAGRVDRGAKLYVDTPRRPEATGAPPGMPPVAGRLRLWRHALERTFPDAAVESAVEVIRELRWIKSPMEVDRLRRNAQSTAAALAAAATSLDAGATQRQSEAAVVAACLQAGAQGPSFWPWTMSGPNAHIGGLVRAFYEYEHLDRVMRAGEVVRVDIGCHGGNYGADVGRTLPVGGKFTAAQAELWDLLVGGYLAGLAAMADGVTVAQVRAASRARVRELGAALSSSAAREAVAQLDTDSAWHLHGVGIDSGEEALPVLRAGAVIAYEPGLHIGVDAFYLEDMILITEDGHEVLSSGLPYSSEEIAQWMQGSWTESR